jgi:hypothetical protein
MIYTGQELTAEALEEIGVLGAGQTSSAEDADAALRRLNRLIDALGLDRLFLHEVRRVQHTLSASTASYTIGTGGTINTPRPTWIDRARLVIDTAATPQTEMPVEVFSPQRWQEIPQKSQTNTYIQGIHYRHDFTAAELGTIDVWPVPTLGTTALVLYMPGTAVTAFANLATEYSLPQGYADALIYNLAKRLAPLMGKPWTPELEDLAVSTLARVKRANHRPVELKGESSLNGRSGGHYNIFTNRFQ